MSYNQTVHRSLNILYHWLRIYFVVYNDTQLEKPATSKQIQEVMEIDSCTKHTMVIRAKQKSEPLTFRDVRRVKLDCESYWEKQRILKEQQKTLTGK